jgi:hypothetical protein
MGTMLGNGVYGYREAARFVLPQSKQELAFVRVSGNTLAEEHS